MVYDNISTLKAATNRVLLRTQTVFPFTFFPDVLEVTDTEVKIIYGIFFWAKQVVHMPIKELYNVRLTTSLLFASLSFEIKRYKDLEQSIHLLPKQDAIEAEAIISGLILCALDDINTLQYSKDELITRVRSMGEPETVKI